MSLQELEALALRLPPSQRALLAQHLIASLDEADEVERVWADEAARRSDALASGAAQSVSAADVFAEARRTVS
ncbi:MAG: addiction module protein [Bacteroidota bacterium]